MTNSDLTPNQLNVSTEEALLLCVEYHPTIGKYIHPTKFLQLLNDRGIVLAISTATPGRDIVSTEFIRGRRFELLNLTNQLEKVLK